MPLFRAYVSKLFLKIFYRKLKKLSNFLITFSIFDKNFSKMDLLMYAWPFFKYFIVHALQGKGKKKSVLTKAGAIFCGNTCFSMEKCAL